MAAAARNGGSDLTIQEIQRKLAGLLEHCKSPRNLETNVERARVEAWELASTVRAYQGVSKPPASRAVGDMLQNLEDRVEAFYDYAELRGDHSDDEHMMGRVRMAQFLRDAIEDMIEYFDAL